MPEVSMRGQTARLRAGSPMPVKTPGRFVLHTFMVEVNDVDFISCTESLPASNEFRGQGGALYSASFSRLNARGGNVFSGKKVYNPTYEPETFLD
jgi:hypothetical protein